MPRPDLPVRNVPSIRHPRRLTIHTLSAGSRRGFIQFGNHTVPCALGRGAIRALKREGDGATPAGVHPVLRVLYRQDRVARPRTALPLTAIRGTDGWCDAPSDRNYNRPVRLPYPASAETLYRTDAVYDIVVIPDYNISRRSRGTGSAIFFHLARPGYAPTEGCIAVTRAHMIRLLARLRRSDTIVVGAHFARARLTRPAPKN